MLDFEFIDEIKDPASEAADRNRVNSVGAQLREHLGDCPDLRVADTYPAADAIAKARGRNAYIHRCNGCELTIGTAAGTDYVLFPWVQKVSNLILNLNAEIRATGDGSIVAVRSVDIRGNTDTGWKRGARALAKRLCELDAPRLSRDARR